jgi:hypothetical protein
MQDVYLRKIGCGIVVVFVLSLLAGCIGEDGDLYLAYSWLSAPQYFYDENPAIPSVFYNGTYYESEEGTYYMEYIAWDGSGWWMNYTLTANPGDLFFVKGAPAYCEIWLYWFGPSLYNWSEPRSIEGQADGESGLDGVQTESRTIGGYTITIVWGRLDAKDTCYK